MKDFLVSCYEAFLYIVTIGSMLEAGKLQHPGLDKFQHVLSTDLDIPTFVPSGGVQQPLVAGNPPIQCSYPQLKGWETCNSATNRSCWLTPPKNSRVPLAPFDINTDYEAIFPHGIRREYHITTENVVLDPDGFIKTKGKAFALNGTNPSYPGPLIEACWGDEIVVHVTNNMKDNGTTIHWHGIRQLNTTEMDGVNGVTQCPIPYGHTFTYKFRAWQYGHTWYHSHYSLQYADGVAGPLLIHGPTSADYDEAFDPIIIADWVHDTSFVVFQTELDFTGVPQTDSIVVDGKGHYNCTGSQACNAASTFTTKVVQKGKRYLLRLINGSAGTSFSFSIDDHMMQIVSNDLVPIMPYKNETLHIAIGQRYSVIVEADQTPDNYWMRTILLSGCSNMSALGSQNNGTAIWRYEGQDSKVLPTTTQSSKINLACVDEPYASLKPVYPWNVGKNPENLMNIDEDVFLATHTSPTAKSDGIFHNYTRWTLTDTPMWLDFAEPTILNLDNSSFLSNPQIALVDYNYHKGFVYIILTANLTGNRDPDRFPAFAAPVAHPIHLHGHDFAILAAGSGSYDEAIANGGVKFNYDNPPRRDVALLDANGYLALAFKPDNPGTWLLHCHIAWHASSGLALQILEDKNGISTSIGNLNQTEETCQLWINSKFRNAIDHEQNDSGI